MIKDRYENSEYLVSKSTRLPVKNYNLKEI